VYAFVSSDGKRGEALRLGAHHVVDSRDGASITKIAGSLDLILLTVDVPLDWATVASSPVGSPGALATMLDFCARQHRADHRDAPTLTGERRAGSTTLQ
jgi:hypothetical protein